MFFKIPHCPRCAHEMARLPDRPGDPHTFSHVCLMCELQGKRVLGGRGVRGTQPEGDYWTFFVPKELNV